MNLWINGRRSISLDARDRGLQYGDGVFETMRVRRHEIRLLDFHLERLYASCRVLKIAAPKPRALRLELRRIAKRRKAGVLKLIVTRGVSERGYRPAAQGRCTRIISLYAAQPGGANDPGAAKKRADAKDQAGWVRVRLCSTPLTCNPQLAGIKTLNRLDSVLARSEWRDARIWEGLMRDADGNWVCGTMSNLFLRRDSILMTPRLDRCGVAGVMRRWILQSAGRLHLRSVECRVRWRDLKNADEVFMSNAVVGVRSVRSIERPSSTKLRFASSDAADRLRVLLDAV